MFRIPCEEALRIVGVDVNSAYVWRGVTRNDGPAVQPWVDLEVAEGFRVHVWGNLDLDDYDGAVDLPAVLQRCRRGKGNSRSWMSRCHTSSRPAGSSTASGMWNISFRIL